MPNTSPLAIDKQTIKDNDITKDVEVSPEFKVAFLQTQKEEIQHALWRARVDIIHAKRLQDSKNPVLQAKGNNNYAEHVNQVQQFVGAVRMIDTLIKELRKEYPELKVG